MALGYDYEGNPITNNAVSYQVSAAPRTSLAATTPPKTTIAAAKPAVYGTGLTSKPMVAAKPNPITSGPTGGGSNVQGTSPPPAPPIQEKGGGAGVETQTVTPPKMGTDPPEGEGGGSSLEDPNAPPQNVRDWLQNYFKNIKETKEVRDVNWNEGEHEAGMNWWQKGLDTLSPEQIAQATAGDITNWEDNGPAGAQYETAETEALAKARELANQDPNAAGKYSQEYLKEVTDAQNEDPLQKAVRDRMTAAAQGGMLDDNSPSGQYYKAMKDEMALNAEQEKKAIETQMAGNRSLYGSKHVGAMSTLARQNAATINTKLADLALNEANGARDFVLADKGLNNTILALGAQIASKGTQDQQTAVDSVLNHISTQTANANTQANIKLESAKANFAAQMAKVTNISDMAKFNKEFDAGYQDMLNDNLNDWFKSLMDGVGSMIPG